jgi:hypothetical protein
VEETIASQLLAKDVAKAREKQTSQRWTYRQSHPQSAAKERDIKRNTRLKKKLEEKAAKLKNQRAGIRAQAMETKTRLSILRCFKS